jgi:hypothetical protein
MRNVICRLGFVALLLLGTSSAWGSQVLPCPPGDTLYFYVLDARPTGMITVEDEYVGMTPDGHERIVQVASTDGGNLFGVCSSARQGFEQAFGVQVGPAISGELFQAHDASGASRIGTVWWDNKPPLANGGALGLQTFYDCKDGGRYTGIVTNVSVFGTMFDVAAINAPATVAEVEYRVRVRAILASLTNDHLLDPSATACSWEITKDQLVTLYWNSAALLYLNLDPVLGIGIGGSP